MLVEYLKSRIIYYLVFFFLAVILLLLQFVLNLSNIIVLTIILSSLVTMTILFIINYVTIEQNFKRVRTKIVEVDKPEFITYYLTRPNHFESGYMYDMLEEISRSLYQRYKQNLDNQVEYQEYLLLFVHDLKLLVQNVKIISNKGSSNEIVEIEDLIDNLLNYSKISLKSVDIKVTSVNLKEILDTIIKRNFDLIIDNNITLDLEYTNLYITTDDYWLSFVLRQLINNAIKYADKKVVISTKELQNETYIVIKNDGKLIRKDEIDLIFDKGYMGSNVNNKSTGYGLYYSNLIADKLSCKLKVTTEDEYNKFLIIFKK